MRNRFIDELKAERAHRFRRKRPETPTMDAMARDVEGLQREADAAYARIGSTVADDYPVLVAKYEHAVKRALAGFRQELRDEWKANGLGESGKPPEHAALKTFARMAARGLLTNALKHAEYHHAPARSSTP